jgi:hypothetical protein
MCEVKRTNGDGKMRTRIIAIEYREPDGQSMAGSAWVVPVQYHADGKSGSLRLSAHCASLREIEDVLNQVQADLEVLKREARNRFGAFAQFRPRDF